MKYNNDSIINSFTKEEKENLFTEIMSMYFHKNFGAVNKTDFETFIFSFYLEHITKEGQSTDDYVLGRDLGITISRVRSLKERKELKYPHKDDQYWQNEFLDYAKNAKFDDVHHLVKFCIPDVNVIKSVRYYFEKNNQYDEIQLNPKLFACRPEAFYEMCKQIAAVKEEEFSWTTTEKAKIEAYIEKSNCSEKERASLSKIAMGAAEDGFKELLISASKEVLLVALSFVNPGVGQVAKKLYEIIENSLRR